MTSIEAISLTTTVLLVDMIILQPNLLLNK